MYDGGNVVIVDGVETVTVVDVVVSPVDEAVVFVIKLTVGCVDVDSSRIWRVVDCSCCAVVDCVVSGELCTVEVVIVVVFSPNDVLRSKKATYKNKLS